MSPTISLAATLLAGSLDAARQDPTASPPGGIASMTDREYWNRRARGMGGR